MIAVERILETVYVFRLSERALDEAIDDASALQAQLRAARAAYANPVNVNGNGAHAPASETPAPKKSRAYAKRGGGEAPRAQGQKRAAPVPALRSFLCAPGQPRQPHQVFSPH